MILVLRRSGLEGFYCITVRFALNLHIHLCFRYKYLKESLPVLNLKKNLKNNTYSNQNAYREQHGVLSNTRTVRLARNCRLSHFESARNSLILHWCRSCRRVPMRLSVAFPNGHTWLTGLQMQLALECLKIYTCIKFYKFYNLYNLNIYL